MGIRGLFSYIENYVEKALEWHKLHNCNLIVDGSNLAYDLYNHCKGKNVAFGGDYDKYSAAVEDFFKKLLLCDVHPYVVMDGGYPLKRQKFKTVEERMSKQLDTCNRVNPDNQSAMLIFPLMGRSVFVNVIQKLGITVLQCDFEADDEIVVIAKRLNAFVLSNDSDFYLFDVPFILLNSVNLKCLQKEVTENDTYKFIPCYVFNAETFAKITKVSTSLLPVLAPALGNDFFQSKCLKEFYIHISDLQPKSAKISDRHKIIMSVLRWLSTQPPEPKVVLEKIINMIQDELSKWKVTALKDTLQSYYPTSSTLESWIENHSSVCPLNKAKKFAYHTDVTSKVNFSSKCFVPVSVEKALKCTCDNRLDTNMIHRALLPGWFIKAYRLHLIPPIVANLLNKNYFFTMPQIEYQDRKSVYLRLECIVRGVRGLLWSSLERSFKMESILKKPRIFHSLLGKTIRNNSAKEIPSSSGYRDTSICTSEDECVSNVLDESYSLEGSENSCSSEYAINDNLGRKDFNEKICNLTGSRQADFDLSNKSLYESGDAVSHTEAEGKEVFDGNVEKLDLEEVAEDDYVDEGNSEEIDIAIFQVKRQIPLVRWYLRNFNYLSAKKLYPERIEKYKNLPTLFDMEHLSIEERKKYFFQICQMKIEFEEELPKNIEFILIIICYWYHKYSGHVHFSSVLSVLMCVLMFCCIDGKCGRKRSRKGFEKIAENSTKIKFLNSNDALPELSTMTVMNILNSLTKEECLLANLSLFQFHDTDHGDNKKNYDRCAVHSFSEYQACFYFLNALNSLLCFPFPSISVESYWSGTFCYNVRKCFHVNNNISVVLATIFGDNVRIIYLFTRLYSIVQKQLGLPVYEEKIVDGPKVRKEKIHIQNKKKLGLKTATQMGILTKRKLLTKTKEQPTKGDNSVDIATEEELARLVGNKFAQLLIV